MHSIQERGEGGSSSATVGAGFCQLLTPEMVKRNPLVTNGQILGAIKCVERKARVGEDGSSMLFLDIINHRYELLLTIIHQVIEDHEAVY